MSSFREQKERFNPQRAHFHEKLLQIAIAVPCKMLHLENPPPYVANNIAWKGNMFLVCVATPCYGMLVVNQLPSRIAQNLVVASGISPKSTCRAEIFGDISEVSESIFQTSWAFVGKVIFNASWIPLFPVEMCLPENFGSRYLLTNQFQTDRLHDAKLSKRPPSSWPSGLQ